MEQRPHGIVRADHPHQVPKTLAEAREILRRLSPDQLLLILSNDMHVFKTDVEDLIRNGELKDPRIPPLAEIINPSQNYTVSSNAEISGISPVDANTELTQTSAVSTDLWSALMRKATKLKR